jgi:TPR repeat protein
MLHADPAREYMRADGFSPIQPVVRLRAHPPDGVTAKRVGARRLCVALLLALLGGLAICSRIDASEGADPAWRAYERGDHAAAAKLYAEAARQGDRLAQFNYAMMLLRGEAVATERGEALRWLRQAADAGMMQAQNNLALLYEKGTGVPRSLTAATTWFERAAKQGHTDAQVSVATQYFLGRGAPKDYAKAAHWYREAANGGDVGAQYILASMYEKGDGVARDLRLALRWYTQAAKQGDAVALVKARAIARQYQEEQR